MDAINLFIEENLGAVALSLFALLVVSLLLILKLSAQLGRMRSKYEFFTRGKSVNIEGVLTDTLKQLKDTRDELDALKKEHARLEGKVKGCVQKVRMERYDAFDAMGGKLSYSLLLADAEDNGVILSSIYGRDDNRCYAKKLSGGKSETKLAEEEERLLKN